MKYDLDAAGADAEGGVADRGRDGSDRVAAGDDDDGHGHQRQHHAAAQGCRAGPVHEIEEDGETEQAEDDRTHGGAVRSAEHTSDLQSLMSISSAAFRFKTKIPTSTSLQP